MRISRLVTLLGVFSATALFAAAPVAQVIGTQSIDVAGIAAPARNFVPMAVGDDVVTHSGAAVVQFRDGSNVTLQANSKLVVEGQPGAPVVRIVQGSASYDLAPYSALRVVNSRGQAINNFLDNALPAPVSVTNALVSPLAPAVVYRNTRQPGMVAPSAGALTGTFVVTGGPASAGSGLPAVNATTAQIILPNNVTVNVQLQANGTYQVTSVTEIVNGVPITATSGLLVGTTLTGATTSNNNNDVVTVGFTFGAGITVSGQQAALAIQTTVQNAAPAGVTVPASSPSPVTGNFSASST